MGYFLVSYGIYFGRTMGYFLGELWDIFWANYGIYFERTMGYILGELWDIKIKLYY